MITKFYKNWRASVIDISFTLKETIKNLNKTALRLCLVNRNNRFYGIITDGDIRRALLKGVKLSDNIIKAVNKKPFFIYEKNLNKKNLEELISTINEKLKNKFINSENILITRDRHRQNLEQCVSCLENFKKKNEAEDFDKAAEDLRMATRHLGMIVGKVDVEEVLGSIFNDFCIGK